MMRAMHRLQPVDGEVRVHLRRRNVGMAQQCLHRAQIGPMSHHVGRAAMPQHVRACAPSGAALHQLPYPAARQRPSLLR